MFHIPELSGREEVAGPFLYLIQRHVKPWTDDTTLVQTSIQVDNNLSRSMIVDYLKLTDVTYVRGDTKNVVYFYLIPTTVMVVHLTSTHTGCALNKISSVGTTYHASS